MPVNGMAQEEVVERQKNATVALVHVSPVYYLPEHFVQLLRVGPLSCEDRDAESCRIWSHRLTRGCRQVGCSGA